MTLNAVQYVTAVSSTKVVYELLTLSENNRIGAKAGPKTTEEDWSIVSSSWNMTSVLTRRAHTPELSKDLEWQKRVDLVKIYLRESYVVWRSKVDSKITDQ